jgi:hypothetical protein
LINNEAFGYSRPDHLEIDGTMCRELTESLDCSRG